MHVSFKKHNRNNLIDKKDSYLCATKKINILTLVLSENNFLNETKYQNPPLQVKWLVPYLILKIDK